MRNVPANNREHSQKIGWNYRFSGRRTGTRKNKKSISEALEGSLESPEKQGVERTVIHEIKSGKIIEGILFFCITLSGNRDLAR